MKLFGTSGIRRIADNEFFELAVKAGLAVGKVCGNVVVGCDTRTSSDAVKHSLIAGLLAAGSKCCDVGVLPTPTLALATREFQAGVMITASHNPPEYNGIKLWNPDGSAFGYSQQEQIESMILNGVLPVAPWSEISSGSIYDGAIEEHIEHIMEDFPGELKLKVVLDCACGAASVITPCLLEKLGCEVIDLNCTPGGFFPHPVEPTEANLGDLIQAVRGAGADLGIAHDGDGDRMMAVDDNGRFIPGDKLLVLFARQAGAKEVVTTIDASMLIDEMGFNVIRTPVGDTCVSEQLKKGGDFGGEPSGSWIFPNSSLCPDGIYAAASLVAMASRQKLSQLVDEVPCYPLVRSSVANTGVEMSDLKRRLLAMKPLSVSDVDGIRLGFEDGWLLVRVSGTEPRIRVTAEARTEERMRQLHDGGVGVVEDCMKGKKEE
ncbi:phosphoglucosamine mutase [Chloroflexota bacterium]